MLRVRFPSPHKVWRSSMVERQYLIWDHDFQQGHKSFGCKIHPSIYIMLWRTIQGLRFPNTLFSKDHSIEIMQKKHVRVWWNGRHPRFRIWCLERAGSSPATRTTWPVSLHGESGRLKIYRVWIVTTTGHHRSHHIAPLKTPLAPRVQIWYGASTADWSSVVKDMRYAIRCPQIGSFVKGISIHRFKSCICHQMQGSALLMWE